MIGITDPESIMLVNQHDTMSTFFSKAVQFLNEYSWTYNFKATDILMEDVRRTIPLPFQNFFQALDETDEQFHNILNLRHNNCWPPELRKFVETCKELGDLSDKLISINESTPTVQGGSTNQPTKLPKKWNPKKYFEVMHVGDFVGSLSVQHGVDAIVDIGSGLGYLASHLSSQFKVPVIGVESEASRVKSAEDTYLSSKRVRDSAPPLQTFVCMRITENISEELEPYTKGYDKVCLSALHACGDLTPWSLKHFLFSESCKCIAVVPCCYHKMNVAGPNFPMSSRMNHLLLQYDNIDFLKNSWLWRLACQRSGSTFLNDIGKETKNLFYRALLEKYAAMEHLRLIRKRRNLQDSRFSTFQEYLDKMIGPNGGFSLANQSDCVVEVDVMPDIYDQLTRLHNELQSWSKVITGILSLQGTLQALAENVILLDRLAFLQESNAVGVCGLTRVIPESVSPRGMVLFGVKK